jgi:predicted ribosomally synthesized peptide with SipW-like signal peptide
MNKKILISLSVIGAVAAIVIGGTVAYFNDTETSTGNTFTAGSLDLTIDNTSYYNGVLNDETTWEYQEPIGLFFNFQDMKPGDWGEDTISVHVSTNDAWACMDFYLYNVDDNGLTEPEEDDGDTTEGAGRGELQNEINFVWWKDDGDNVLEDNETPFQQTVSLAQLNTFSIPLADSNGQGVLSAEPLVASTDYYIGKAWCYGELVLAPVPAGEGQDPTVNSGFTCDGAILDNITQSDSVQGTLSFRAIQSRNNSDFICQSLCSNVSFLYEDSFEGVDGDTSGWSTDNSEVNLGTNTWSLLSGSANVYGYRNGGDKNLTHRGTRGLGVAGGENDEVDAPERIEIVFDSPVLINEFEIRSLFANEDGKDEEGDVELYNGVALVANYHLTATQAGGNGVLETFGSNQAVDKIVFYVQGGQPYTSYSEFAVAKARICPVPVE